MKSLVVHGAGDLRIDERADPRPAAGEVLIRTTHGGICGSDLHYYRHRAVGAFTLRRGWPTHCTLSREIRLPTGPFACRQFNGRCLANGGDRGTLEDLEPAQVGQWAATAGRGRWAADLLGGWVASSG